MKKILSILLITIALLSVFGGISIYATETKDGSEPSPPLDYLHAGEVEVRMISSHIKLENILDYNGRVQNMHIAKWVNSSNEDLEFPAYCVDPGIVGVANHGDKRYDVGANATLSEDDKKILGIMRAGYPYKTPDQLGVVDEIDAYYATQCAIWHYIKNGDDESTLDIWEAHSSDAERNSKILAAMKQIYLIGKANPYSPPEINWSIEPVNGDGSTDKEEGEWIVNEYEVISDYPYTELRLMFLGDDIKQLAQNGKIKVTDMDGNQFYQERYVAGTWDNNLAYRIPAGTMIKIWYDKALAQEQKNVNISFIGSINDVAMEYTVTYLGGSSLGEGWQGYAYNFIPYQADISEFKYTVVDRQELLVEKRDAKTGDRVKGAVFQINGISENNRHINLTVNATANATPLELDEKTVCYVEDGLIQIIGIPAGHYEITEISAPPHYAPPEVRTQTVEVTKNGSTSASVVFENQPYGKMRIRKIDSVTNQPMDGVTLQVVNPLTGFSNQYVTQNGGYIDVIDLPEATYIITEVATLPGYVLSKEVITATVRWGEETLVTFKNEPYGGIIITKVDTITGAHLPGANIMITSLATGQTWDVITGADGTASVELPPGEYTVQEKNAPLGYELSACPQTVIVLPGETSYIKIQNYPFGSMIITKIDAKTGLPMAGVKLRIYNDTLNYDKTETTDSNGQIHLTDLKPGDYTITEVATIPGYELSTEVLTRTVAYGKETTVTFKNEPKGSVTVIKVDSITGEHLPGANIKLTNPATGQTWDLITGADGTATVEDLEAGEYYFQEQNAPLHYELNSQTIPVRVVNGENSSVKIQNNPFGSMLITKIDNKTSLPMAGVKLRIYNDTLNYDKTETTDSNGQIHLLDLKPGDYTITEVATIPGYELSTEVLTRTVAYGKETTVTFKNEPKGSVTVIKVDSITGEHLPGANIKLTNPATGQTWDLITGADGTATVEDLAAGEYYFQEQNPPLHYELNSQTFPVRVVNGENSSVKIQNNPLGKLEITKVSSVDPTKTLAGVKLRVQNTSLGIDNTYTTDENGKILLIDLKPGDYHITEVATIPGYVLSDEVVIATINYGKTTNAIFKNEPKPGLTILKRDKDTLKPLAGAVFSVEKIGDPNNGAITGNVFTTDENGKIYIADLLPGSYKITEVQAPYGYNLSEINCQIITMRAGENNTATFENTRQPLFTLTKVDSKTGLAIEGAAFTVEKLDNPNKGAVTGTPLYTDENGQIKIPNLLSGMYQVTEVQPANGYGMPSPNVWEINIKANEDYNLKVKNTRLPSLVINKIDSWSYKGIPNTYFEIFYAVNGSFYGDVRSLGTFKTDAKGQIVIPNCQPGWYRYTEVRPAQGYSKPSNPTKDVFLSLGDNAYSGIGADAWMDANGQKVMQVTAAPAALFSATQDEAQTEQTAIQTSEQPIQEEASAVQESESVQETAPTEEPQASASSDLGLIPSKPNNALVPTETNN